MGDCFPVERSGFLVAKELDAFAKVLDKAAKPVLAISGGAKDEATRCDVMAEEVLVPQGEHLIPGGVSDRFRQCSGRLRLVSSPLWSSRLPMCPL